MKSILLWGFYKIGKAILDEVEIINYSPIKLSINISRGSLLNFRI